MITWDTIENAPKDGAPILVARQGQDKVLKDTYYAIAYWGTDKEHFDSEGLWLIYHTRGPFLGRLMFDPSHYSKLGELEKENA